MEDAKENAEVELGALQKRMNLMVPAQRRKVLAALRQEMMEAADRLDYEDAAALRDKIMEIEKTYGK